MHSRHTGTTLDLDSTRLWRSRSGTSCGSGLTRRFGARTVLTSLTAVGCGVTTVTVHGTTGALSPGTANCVTKLGTTASINSRHTSWLSVGRARGLTKNRLASGSDRGGTSGSDRGGCLADRSAILAAVLATVRDKTMTIGASAVTVNVRRETSIDDMADLPVRGAATSISSLSVTRCSAKVLTAPAVVSGSRRAWCGLSSCCRCSRFGSVVATRETTISAMCWSVSALKKISMLSVVVR